MSTLPPPIPPERWPAGQGCTATEWLRENLELGNVLDAAQINLISAFYLSAGSAVDGELPAMRARRAGLSTPRRYVSMSNSVAAVAAHHANASGQEEGAVYEEDDDEDDDEDEDEEDGGPQGDLLDRIDALTGDMCVCGCRRRVKPDGPSEFFRSASCQRRWHAQHHADNPQQVLRRPEAARVYVGADHLPVPLREPSTGPAPDAVGNAATQATSLMLDDIHLSPDRPHPCPDPHGAAYRRTCPGCSQAVIPLVGVTGRFHLADDGGGHGQAAGTLVTHGCPHCLQPLPGPAYLADVIEQPDRLVLELSDVTSRVRQVITFRRLAAAANRSELVAATWSELERQLGRFQRAWRGTRNTT